LPDHPDDLAAMQRCVIDHVLHLLAKREGVLFTRESFETQIARQIGIRHAG
jgi:hypothetical protein